MQHAIKARAGFTLLEMAVALAIFGIIGAATMKLYDTSQRQIRIDKTYDNMNRVLSALGTYVESASRLPCPADPGRNDELFGWEWGVDKASINVRPIPAAGSTCNDWTAPPAAGGPPKNIGIVPFLTLGLKPEDVKDGWGRYLTYAVSPVYAQNNDSVDASAARTSTASYDQGRVHMRCLDGGWYDNKDNINGPKARFCCNGDPSNATGAALKYQPNSDIQIRFTDNTVIWPRAGEVYSTTRDTTPANYNFASPLMGGGINVQYEASYGPTQAPALVLISHGTDGNGAFLGNGTRNRLTMGASSTMEQENGAGTLANSWDRVFMVGPRNLETTNHFDNIVAWRTQFGIMAQNGTSSCRYP